MHPTISTTTTRVLPQGGDGAPAAADHLPGVVVGHVQLQDDRAVVLVESLDRHLVGIVDEGPSEELEEILQPSPGTGLRASTS